MPLSADDLIDKMLNGLGNPTDKDGNKVDKTKEFTAFAKGFIAMIKAGTISTTVTGTGIPNGGPFTGTASGQLMGLKPTLMATEIKNAIPQAKKKHVEKEANAIAKYIMANGNVNFSTVTGTCTAATGSPPSPGMLVNGAADNGKLSGLDGKALGKYVSDECDLPDAKDIGNMYDELCKYVMQNISLVYPPNSITGTFPPPPPAPIPIVGGSGSGGIIS